MCTCFGRISKLKANVLLMGSVSHYTVHCEISQTIIVTLSTLIFFVQYFLNIRPDSFGPVVLNQINNAEGL